MIRYQMKIHKEDGSYWAEFPDLAGCFTEADSSDELLKNAREALDLYLDEAKNPSWELPKARSRSGSSYIWVYPSARVSTAIRIRQARIEKGFSQAQLAKELGIAKQQVQKLESPLKSNPTINMLERIAKVLGFHLAFDFAA